MTSFLNQEGYVKVGDLPLQGHGTYSDYEELAFDDTGSEPYELLRDVVAHYYLYHEDEKEAQLQQDYCDLAFYVGAHVILYWDEKSRGPITETALQCTVEGAIVMVSETLQNEWVCRPRFDWKELSAATRR